MQQPEDKTERIRAILNDEKLGKFLNKAAFAQLIAPPDYSNPRIYFSRKLDENAGYSFSEDELAKLAGALHEIADKIKQELEK